MSPGQLTQLIVKHFSLNSFPIVYITDCNHLKQVDDLINLQTAERNTLHYTIYSTQL